MNQFKARELDDPVDCRPDPGKDVVLHGPPRGRRRGTDPPARAPKIKKWAMGSPLERFHGGSI